VIQEAAAAGLGVICSDECGAGDVFVQQGINGIIVPTGSVAALAGAMRTFSESGDLLDYAPNTSFDMSKRLMTSSFAETVIYPKKGSSSHEVVYYCLGSCAQPSNYANGRDRIRFVGRGSQGRHDALKGENHTKSALSRRQEAA
jgi:hypothetical protein